MSLVIAIAIAVIMTCLIMLGVRGRKTPAVATAAVFGLVVVALMVGTRAYSLGQNTSRAADRREAANASMAAAQRAYDAQATQYSSCVAKVATRADLRTVFFALVDLSDLFPNSPGAEQYTASRRALIDAKYPALKVDTECGVQPTPPTAGRTP